MDSSQLFAYNKKNLESTCRLKGKNRERVLAEMELMRTYEFKKIPKSFNKDYGKWIKRKKPIPEINFSCSKK